MTTKKLYLTIAITALLCGCVTRQNLEYDFAFDAQKDAVIILGSNIADGINNPEGKSIFDAEFTGFKKIIIWGGKIFQSVFRFTFAWPAEIMLTPKRSYLVARIEPVMEDKAYGVLSVGSHRCRDKTLVFQVSAGTVLYVGDLNEANGALVYMYSPDEAKKYIYQNYPQLLPYFMAREHSFTPMIGECTYTGTNSCTHTYKYKMMKCKSFVWSSESCWSSYWLNRYVPSQPASVNRRTGVYSL